MACYKPLSAWTRAPGGNSKRAIYFKNPGKLIGTPIKLPCGQCIGCRLDKSISWATRCMHEASMHKENCFLTLTYGETDEISLNYTDYQKFMKALRHRFPEKHIRFFMVGEYGLDQDDVNAGMRNPGLGRQHFHALIFGHDFKDREFLKTTGSGEKIWRSETLEKLWSHGFSSVADLTFESAAYCARYSLKKVTGEKAEEHYVKVCKYTGEIKPVKPEFINMSRRPGIGAKWLEKYKTDVYPHDNLKVLTKNGIKTVSVPAYYDKLLEEKEPDLLEEIKLRRIENAKRHEDNNTHDRLEVREYIHNVKAHQLARNKI